MRQAKLLVMSTTMMLAACGGTKDAGQSAEALIGKSDIKIEGMRMTPEALWAMGRIGEVSVSPDNQKIVYSVAYYSVPENKSNRELFTMKADGSDNKQITHTPYQENGAIWIKDGTKIAFLSNDNGSSQTMRVVANVIFIVASLTDLFDGKIARKYNLVTNFGKFMDPLADKLLVCSALICMIELRELPAWMVIIIISREFIISGFRLVAADNGIVIAASYWGKFKTTFQMIAVILMIFNIPALKTVTFIMLAAAVVLTIVSLVDYVAKNVEVLTKGGM